MTTVCPGIEERLKVDILLQAAPDRSALLGMWGSQAGGRLFFVAALLIWTFDDQIRIIAYHSRYTQEI